MPEAGKPENEAARLEALRELGLDADVTDPWCDWAATAAAAMLDCPMGIVSIVREDRQTFRGRVGTDRRQTPRNIAFCTHTILGEGPLVICDARSDARVRDNPLVTGEPGVRFYAGVPLVMPGGLAVGTLCVLDTRPRDLTRGQVAGLRALASMVRDRLGEPGRLREAERAVEAERRVSAELRAARGALEAEARAREAAQRQADSLRHALDTAGIVAITDRAGTITYVNDNFCRISGYERHELIGQNHRLLNSGHHPRRFFTQMYAAIARGLPWRAEVCNRSKSGELYWVDTTIVPQMDRNGRVEAYIALRIDVTSKKRAESELVEARVAAEAASRAKSEFLANMSHEIRTPLTAILGFAELLETDAEVRGDPARRADAVRTILRAGRHLHTIIGDILDLSKIEAGQMNVESVATSPRALVAGIESLLRPRAIEKGLTLTARVGESVPERVLTDPTRLRQVLLNLLGNAVKFTDSGAVSLRLRAEAGADGGGGLLVADVEDTGPGLTAEQALGLFTPFTQADGTVTRRAGGTGLGLSICRRLARLMGGDTLLVRTEPGRGSLFRLTLPLRPASGAEAGGHEEPRAEMERPGPSAAPAGRRLAGRVLLAEDGPDNQRLICLHLRGAGAQVTVAPDGAEALAELLRAEARGEPFDLLVTDIQMPVMDGYTLARRLRAMGQRLPIVALTAHTTPEDRRRCEEAGCNGYATKPIDRAALIETCRYWLEAGRAEARAPTPPTAPTAASTASATSESCEAEAGGQGGEGGVTGDSEADDGPAEHPRRAAA